MTPPSPYVDPNELSAATTASGLPIRTGIGVQSNTVTVVANPNIILAPGSQQTVDFQTVQFGSGAPTNPVVSPAPLSADLGRELDAFVQLGRAQHLRDGQWHLDGGVQHGKPTRTHCCTQVRPLRGRRRITPSGPAIRQTAFRPTRIRTATPSMGPISRSVSIAGKRERLADGSGLPAHVERHLREWSWDDLVDDGRGCPRR